MRSVQGRSLSRMRAICSSTHRSGSRQTTFQRWPAGIAFGPVKRLPRTDTSSGVMPSCEVISSARTCRPNNAKQAYWRRGIRG
ncbi:hypothetical protein J2S46_008174 [Kitasatospora herbaricolor]|nr:hypothetical protein [Kitasatospora herbaricolor]